MRRIPIAKRIPAIVYVSRGVRESRQPRNGRGRAGATPPSHQIRKRMFLHAAAGMGVSAYVVLFVIPSRDKKTPNSLPIAFEVTSTFCARL